MQQSSHDYGHLMRRWRSLVRQCRLQIDVITRVDNFPVYCVRSPALAGRPGFYLSAGIHGDEPASTEGLLAWAQRVGSGMERLPVLIFPCLNPWGLVMNRRSDASGNDLNRLFHADHHPTVAAVRRVSEPYAFESALLLHEDYDARGVYLYELSKHSSIGDAILSAAATVLPRDPRPRVDGRRSRNGIVATRFSTSRYGLIGHPEAVWLHLRGCPWCITFETPSEAGLDLRIDAQVAAIARMVEMCTSPR
jgi:protein MpaA